MVEQWKNIEGFDGIYQISNKGNVRSFYSKAHNKNGQFKVEVSKTKWHYLKPHTKENGYLQIELRTKELSKHYYVHRLVALYFLDNPYNLKQVNHKDFNKANNSVSNLEWVSRGQNLDHWKKSPKYNKDYENKMKNLFSKTFEFIIKNKDEIINLRKQGYSILEISKIMNIGRDRVSSILSLYKDYT